MPAGIFAMSLKGREIEVEDFCYRKRFHRPAGHRCGGRGNARSLIQRNEPGQFIWAMRKPASMASSLRAWLPREARARNSERCIRSPQRKKPDVEGPREIML